MPSCLLKETLYSTGMRSHLTWNITFGTFCYILSDNLRISCKCDNGCSVGHAILNYRFREVRSCIIEEYQRTAGVSNKHEFYRNNFKHLPLRLNESRFWNCCLFCVNMCPHQKWQSHCVFTFEMIYGSRPCLCVISECKADIYRKCTPCFGESHSSSFSFSCFPSFLTDYTLVKGSSWSVKAREMCGCDASVTMLCLFRVTTWTERRAEPPVTQFTKSTPALTSRWGHRFQSTAIFPV